MIIQGRRMPNRDEVRSLILPKNGLANMASSAPVPATSARLFGACSIPTRELIFSAKLTSSGARNNRMVPDVRQGVQQDEAPADPACDPWCVRIRRSAAGAVPGGRMYQA